MLAIGQSQSGCRTVRSIGNLVTSYSTASLLAAWAPHDPRLNSDVLLAIGSAPETGRSKLVALWSLDEAFGRVLATGREPMVGRIRLAWWREALERLDGAPPPAEPVLQAVAARLLPAGLSGARLAAMEAGWAAALGDQPLEPVEIETYAAARGGLLFGFTAELLGAPDHPVGAAGAVWALVDLARHSSEPSDVAALLAAAGRQRLPTRWPRRLRPLGMLAVLAQRDLKHEPERWEPPGAPPRTARMLRHRLTGW